MKKISLLVTHKCFMQCEGCYLDKRIGEELTSEEFLGFSDVLLEAGFEGVTVSGGDPLTRGDIKVILNGLKKRGFSVNLDTVGNPIPTDPTLAETIKDSVDLLGIPIDGITNETAGIFRTSNPKIFDQQISIIKTLNDAQIPTAINTVVHQGNLVSLSGILKILEGYENIKRWELHQFVKLSRGSKSIAPKMEVSLDDFNSATAVLHSNCLAIDPKPSNRKENFRYLDSNGDLVKVTSGKKNILGNIRNLGESKLISILKAL